MLFDDGSRLCSLQDNVLTDVSTDIPLTPAEKTELLSQLYKESGDYAERKESMVHAAPGTCAWVLEHESFLEWQRAEKSCLLWITAEAGCGKTVLADFLVDNVQRDPDDIVAHYFFKGGEKEKANQALCGLIHQVFIKRDSATKHLVGPYRTAGKGNQMVYESTTLWNILETSSSDGESSCIICIIDALDECVDRGAILKQLKATFGRSPDLAGKQITLKVIITSRPYPEITEGFRSVLKIRLKAEDESVKTLADIQKVVKIRLAKLKTPEPGLRSDFSDDLLTDLADIIPKKAGRTFLWVKLIFDIIAASSSHTRQHIRKLVQQTPVSLDEMYGNALAATDDPGSTNKLLRIVFSATRPLTLAEINIALCFDLEAPSVGSLELEVQIERRIRMTCGILLTISNQRVDFIHHTAREFLESQNPSLPRSWVAWRQTLSEDEAHEFMAKICISYLAAPDWDDYLKASGCYRNQKSCYYVHKAQWSRSMIGWWMSLALIEYAATSWFIHHNSSSRSRNTGHHDSISQICDPSTGIYECWTPHVPDFNFKVASPVRLIDFSTLNGYSFISDHVWMSATERKWIPLAEEWYAFCNKLPSSLILDSLRRLRTVQWSKQMLDRVFNDALQLGDTRLIQYLFVSEDNTTPTAAMVAAFDCAVKQDNLAMLNSLYSENHPMHVISAVLDSALERKNAAVLSECLTRVDYNFTLLQEALDFLLRWGEMDSLFVVLNHLCNNDRVAYFAASVKQVLNFIVEQEDHERLSVFLRSDWTISFTASVQEAVKISLVHRDATSLLLLLDYLRDHDEQKNVAHEESCTTDIWTLSSVISEALDRANDTNAKSYSDRQRLCKCIWKAIFNGASLRVETYSKLLSAMFRAILLKGEAAGKDRCKGCGMECLLLRRHIVEAAISWRDDLIPFLARAQQMCHCVEEGFETQMFAFTEEQSAAAPSLRRALHWTNLRRTLRPKTLRLKTLRLRNAFATHNLLGARPWEDPTGYRSAERPAKRSGPEPMLPSKRISWVVPHWRFDNGNSDDDSSGSDDDSDSDDNDEWWNGDGDEDGDEDNDNGRDYLLNPFKRPPTPPLG